MPVVEFLQGIQATIETLKAARAIADKFDDASLKLVLADSMSQMADLKLAAVDLNPDLLPSSLFGPDLPSRNLPRTQDRRFEARVLQLRRPLHLRSNRRHQYQDPKKHDSRLTLACIIETFLTSVFGSCHFSKRRA